jgi:hypothetical protein
MVGPKNIPLQDALKSEVPDQALKKIIIVIIIIIIIIIISNEKINK